MYLCSILGKNPCLEFMNKASGYIVFLKEGNYKKGVLEGVFKQNALPHIVHY